jgi:glycosyltransferase involved in cell wall biosynthesis
VTDPALKLIHFLAPGGFGGAESVVRMLADGLARRGHGVHVALTLDEGLEHPLENELRGSPLELTAWRLPARAYRREAELVTRLCERLTPDVVHTHGYRSDVIVSRALSPRSCGLVSTAHGFTLGGAKNRFFERLQRRAYRRFDAVVAVSRSVEQRLAEAGVEEARLHLVPNAWVPTPTALDRVSARQELGLPQESVLAGWVGRLSPEKGADVLIDAIARLEDVPVDFVIVGDGPERSSLAAQARALGVSDRLHWPGAVARAGRLFRAFDLFVLSSRTEGTPIVLFEAMEAGVPIVATRVGGVPDVLSPREAILVPPSDPAALADAISGAVRDPRTTESLVRLARSRLGEAHGPDAWLGSHEAIYRGISE